ncbi:MAG: DUF6270 domain-containing protein [Clostridia bacterium]|nr:DUF6270 domain-containing protein [Clostridia bacterium]
MEELTVTEKMPDDKIHVSILGSCILRDTIGYYHEGEKFIVDRFVQDISPLTVVGDSPLLKPLGDFIYESQVLMSGKPISNFGKRNITLDLEKTTIQYVSESHSKWLLIDAVCLRKVILKYQAGNISLATSGIKPFQPLLDLLSKEGYLSTYKDIVQPQNMQDKEFYGLLDKFVEKLKEIYPQDKVILFNVRATKYCAMRDGTINNFTFIEYYNAVYKGYDYLLSKLPYIHIIDYPVNILSDENHKWGRADLHYVREYYDYAYAALEKICGGGTPRLKKRKPI